MTQTKLRGHAYYLERVGKRSGVAGWWVALFLVIVAAAGIAESCKASRPPDVVTGR